MLHGRYTVVRKLAEGGMAEIFLARQHGSEGFEKTVVLKRIHTAFYADEQFRNMLIDEAHISMSLHHNNIVHVLDLGRSGGRLFLALELVDGWDLHRIVQRAAAVGAPMPIGIGVYIASEVCRALSYAHSCTKPDGQPLGIVHRDVSPQNVLISEQGEVKLTDFGIAKALTKRDRTASGVVKGKIAFMSPEQATGQEIDARSDVFAVGTMLYLLATRVRPFEGPTDFEVLARVQKCVYTPPEEVKPDLPAALVAVIKRALTFDRDQRYQTADELLLDLEALLRREYATAGQTALKLWLRELQRLDGVPPIGKAPVPTGAPALSEGSDSLEAGDALELGDEGEALDELGELGGVDSLQSSDELPLVDGPGLLERRTSATAAIKMRPHQTAPKKPGVVTGVERTAMNDLSLPLMDADPSRVQRYHSGGGVRAAGVGLIVVGLLVGGGGYALWRFSPSSFATLKSFLKGGPAPEPEASAAPVPPRPAADASAQAREIREAREPRGEGRTGRHDFERRRAETRERRPEGAPAEPR